MPKTKISEYSATANSNTDVASINIDEGCAPSGINNAIRAVMGHLKDFQQGTNSDPFNGPVNGTVGATTPSTGAFTTLSASGNVTLGDASTDTLNVGNGGLIKDASGNVGVGVTPSSFSTGKAVEVGFNGNSINGFETGSLAITSGTYYNGNWYRSNAYAPGYMQYYRGELRWYTGSAGTAGTTYTPSQAMTLDASGNLGVGTTSPGARLDVVTGSTNRLRVSESGSSLFFDSLNAAASAWAPKIERATQYQWLAGASGTPATGMALDSSGNLTLSTGAQYFGMSQYTYKKQMMFNYPVSGFEAGLDCTDFYTSGSGASDVNVQARLSQFGNFGLRGTLTNSATLNDYAEYFEWSDGNQNAEDRVGKSVVLDENKIRLATEQDNAADIVGVVSATAGVALGCGALEWGGKYLRDDLGRQLTQEVTYVIWNDGEARQYVQGEVPDGVVIPEDAIVRTYQEQVLNPDFDENAPYQSRNNRPEWAAIGLMGQLRIIKGQPVGDRWRKMRDISETVEEWLVK